MRLTEYVVYSMFRILDVNFCGDLTSGSGGLAEADGPCVPTLSYGFGGNKLWTPRDKTTPERKTNRVARR